MFIPITVTDLEKKLELFELLIVNGEVQEGA